MPTTSQSEAREESREDEQGVAGRMVTNVKNYIVTLGLPASKLLTQHAAVHHHEDVPSDTHDDTEGQ
jgi:hypothetical protein